jgi:hypothetical protein
LRWLPDGPWQTAAITSCCDSGELVLRAPSRLGLGAPIQVESGDTTRLAIVRCCAPADDGGFTLFADLEHRWKQSEVGRFWAEMVVHARQHQ